MTNEKSSENGFEQRYWFAIQILEFAPKKGLFAMVE